MRVVLLLAALCALSCGAREDLRLVEQSAVSMGTELRLSAITSDDAAARAAFAAVFAEFDRLDGLMSVWREGSDVERINAAAGAEPVAVRTEVLEVLRAAQAVSELSDGAFDVTFAALSGLWRFDHDQDGRIPPPAAIAARLPLIGYRQVEIGERTARLARTGMRIHLGGIGKGYAIDRAAALLRRHGVRDFLIQSGGDIYAGGRRDAQAWRVGIRDPRGANDEIFAALALSNAAISTSGDYERFFVQGGRRYHHILDPRTGESAAGTRSATVVAASALASDALSTAVFVLGPEAGLALIERLPEIEAVIVSAANDVLVSSGLAGRVELLRLPGAGQ